MRDPAREAAPHAIQIADRFHLSQHVGEMVVRMMRRNYDRVKELLDEVSKSAEPIDQSLPFHSLISSRDTARARLPPNCT
jgi:transposase